MIVVFVVCVVGYQGNVYVIIVVLIEFIYMVMLLYDDVVDEFDMCCGKVMVNVVFGNVVSVLVGDFIYICVFQMMISFGLLKVLEVMLEVVNVIVEGEVL